MDFYGGFKEHLQAPDADFNYDVGVLEYYYPGDYPADYTAPLHHRAVRRHRLGPGLPASTRTR